MMKMKLLAVGLWVGAMVISAQAALQVHLPLDGNLTDVANGHTVTLTDGASGTTSFVTGQVGTAAIRIINPVSTATETDYVGINYTLTDEGAIALWYMPESLYNYQTVFCNSVNEQDFEMWVYGTGELAARIQELFGLAETPRIAGGRVPVVLHLLAPNMRPQQVTDDLRSFWDGTYPQVRKELRRRYPRHAWPEDPWTAQAIRGPRRRRR